MPVNTSEKYILDKNGTRCESRSVESHESRGESVTRSDSSLIQAKKYPGKHDLGEFQDSEKGTEEHIQKRSSDSSLGARTKVFQPRHSEIERQVLKEKKSKKRERVLAKGKCPASVEKPEYDSVVKSLRSLQVSSVHQSAELTDKSRVCQLDKCFQDTQKSPPAVKLTHSSDPGPVKKMSDGGLKSESKKREGKLLLQEEESASSRSRSSVPHRSIPPQKEGIANVRDMPKRSVKNVATQTNGPRKSTDLESGKCSFPRPRKEKSVFTMTTYSGSKKKTLESTASSSGSKKKTPESTASSSGSKKKTLESTASSTGAKKETLESTASSSGSEKKTLESTASSSGSEKKTLESTASSSGSEKKNLESTASSSGSEKKNLKSAASSSGSEKETLESTATSKSSGSSKKKEPRPFASDDNLDIEPTTPSATRKASKDDSKAEKEPSKTSSQQYGKRGFRKGN